MGVKWLGHVRTCRRRAVARVEDEWVVCAVGVGGCVSYVCGVSYM